MADIRLKYGGHTKDIWRMVGGHTANICHTADMRRTYDKNTANMRPQTFGEHTAYIIIMAYVRRMFAACPPYVCRMSAVYPPYLIAHFPHCSKDKFTRIRK